MLRLIKMILYQKCKPDLLNHHRIAISWKEGPDTARLNGQQSSD